jgi:anthranilate synthase/aminodeoxychorismate synthase-like glutamine amidotransferase
VLIVIDNYDSFTWNLVHYLEVLNAEPRVFRNDEISVDELLAIQPSHVIISPGPGTPADAGISRDMIRAAAGRIPILGVCLGHQCMAEVYGGRVVRCEVPVHGKTAKVRHDGSGVFAGLPNPLIAARYHSLTVEANSLPDCLSVTAWTDDGLIMGLRHRTDPIFGVQFHPESILTDSGPALLRNFLAIEGGGWA